MRADFKTKFQQIREALRLSQEVFGESFGASEVEVAEHEAGDSRPMVSEVMAVIEAHNVNPEWMFNSQGEMFARNEDVQALDRMDRLESLPPVIEQAAVRPRKKPTAPKKRVGRDPRPGTAIAAVLDGVTPTFTLPVAISKKWL